MAKFDLHKTQGINNVMNAIQQVKSVNNIIPLTEAKELPLESIYPSGENFYSVAELDELSDSIRELGILQPLLVSERGNGTYEIIAGNRRYEAAKMTGLERLPCVVKQNVEPSLFKIMLIHANMFRVKTDIERAMEVAELKKAIIALKSADKSIKGRTNEIAGQILNLSYRQVNRLDNLNKLIPEIQYLVQNERLTSSCAEQFAGLEEGVQKEIHEVLINSGMAINRDEAAKLKAGFLAQSRAIEMQKEADMESLRAQIREEQVKLKEKEQELESLMGRIQAQELLPSQQRESARAGGSLATPNEKRELDKVKQALVSALQDRKDIEDRYNALSQMLAGQNGGVPVTAMSPSSADTERLMNDVKRKTHLQECIGQLKLASRTYNEYKKLYRSVAPVKPSVDENDLLSELVSNIKDLSRLITTEQEAFIP